MVAEDGEHGVGGLAGIKKLGMHATVLWVKLAFAHPVEDKFFSSILIGDATGKSNLCEK